MKGPGRMSMDFGGESFTEPETLKEIGWPCLRQFCIFMENRVGILCELLRQLEKHDLRVMGLCIVESAECAIARLVMSETDRCRELLDLAGLTYMENNVIGVELPEEEQPFLTVCHALLRAELNIHYTYPLLYRRQGRPGIVILVDDIDSGIEILREQGLRVITETDLLDDDYA